MKKTWGFKRVTTAAVVILVLLPLLISGVSLWILLRPGLEQQQLQSQTALARSVASQIESYLNEGVNEINLFAAYLEEWEHRIQPSQLQEFVQLALLFEVVYLADDQGVVQMAGVPASSLIRLENLDRLDISRMNYFQVLMNDNTEQWSDAFLSSASGDLAVAYSMELQGTEDYRYLIGELSIHSLPELLRSIGESSGQTVMILDAADQLIGHPDQSLSRQQLNLKTLPILNAEESEYGQIGQYRFQGTDFYGSLIRIPDPQWKIIVALPESEFWDLFFLVFRSLLVVLVVALILVVGLSRWLGRRLSHEFSAYSGVVERLAQGDYNAKPPTSMITELSRLSDDLIQTGEAIARREQQLAEANVDLERHVEERTRDLLAANSEQARTLEQLKSAQIELVESGKLAALGSLVAGVSHELNTPIGVSVTASTSVVDDAKTLRKLMQEGKLSKSDFEDHLTHIIDGSELIARNLMRASELIASFKQVAVDQSSDLRRQFVLTDVIQDVVSTLKPKYKGKNFEFKVAADDGVEMDSFPGSLIQVLTNLVDNAIFHGYDGFLEGVVQINSRRLSRTHVEIVVEDYGAGIDEAHLQHIFEPFYTTKLGQGGSGLGLNIVHAIVQKILGGKIEVASRTGEGSRFTLLIPVKAPDKVRSAEELVVIEKPDEQHSP